MLVFIIRRCLQSVLALLVMSALIFVGVFAIGNPVDILINPQADQAEIARATAALGLDQPLWVQYWEFLRHALAGDLGRSFSHNVPAVQLIFERMPATVELALSRHGDGDRARHSARPVSPVSSPTRGTARRSWPDRFSVSACRRSGSGSC